MPESDIDDELEEGFDEDPLVWTIHDDPSSYSLTDWDSLGVKFEREVADACKYFY